MDDHGGGGWGLSRAGDGGGGGLRSKLGPASFVRLRAAEALSDSDSDFRAAIEPRASRDCCGCAVTGTVTPVASRPIRAPCTCRGHIFCPNGRLQGTIFASVYFCLGLLAFPLQLQQRLEDPRRPRNPVTMTSTKPSTSEPMQEDAGGESMTSRD